MTLIDSALIDGGDRREDIRDKLKSRLSYLLSPLCPSGFQHKRRLREGALLILLQLGAKGVDCAEDRI